MFYIGLSRSAMLSLSSSMKSMGRRSVSSDHLVREVFLKYMKSMTRQCSMQIFHPFFHTLNISQKEKNIYALKTVNLKNQSERSKGELIKEIVFLEKLKNCNGVVKAFEYELHETEDDHWMYVLMEKGDMDLQKVINKGRLNCSVFFLQILINLKESGNLTPSRLRFYWEQMLLAIR